LILTPTYLIRKAYKNNEFRPFIFYGPYGYGKTSLAIKVLAQLYGEWDGDKLIKPCWDWEVLRDKIVMTPPEFVEKMKQLVSQNKRDLCLLADDAGLWLFALDWYDPFVKAVTKFLNVARTCLASVIFTTPLPTMILGKVRGLPQLISVKIVKATGNPEKHARWMRYATGYRWVVLPDMKKTMVKVVFRDRFYCKLPDDIYKKYCELRQQYVDSAVYYLKKELARSHIKHLELLKSASQD